MAKSFSELQTLAIQIRDELNKKKNSAQRVGSALLDIIDNCIQNITDIKQKLSVFEHACSGFKRVSSEVQLPVTPSQEDLAKGFLVNTSLYLYVGTGGNAVNGRYFNVGDIRGPQGEPGSKGETGKTGPTGEKGEQGNSGVTGDTSDIVVINNLDGGESEEGSIKVLAAEQGKVLNKKFTELKRGVQVNSKSLNSVVNFVYDEKEILEEPSRILEGYSLTDSVIWSPSEATDVIMYNVGYKTKFKISAVNTSSLKNSISVSILNSTTSGASEKETLLPATGEYSFYGETTDKCNIVAFTVDKDSSYSISLLEEKPSTKFSVTKEVTGEPYNAGIIYYSFKKDSIISLELSSTNGFERFILWHTDNSDNSNRIIDSSITPIEEGTKYRLTIPADTPVLGCYISSSKSTSVTINIVELGVNDIVKDLIKEVDKVESNLGEVSTDVDDLNDFVAFAFKNIYNPQKGTEGYFITNAGHLQANPIYAVTDYIPLNSDNPSIIISALGFEQISATVSSALYNSDKKYISGSAISMTTEEGKLRRYSDGVAFVRYSVNKTLMSNVQIEYGETPTDYAPYGAPSIKTDATITFPNDICLPKKQYCLNGVQNDFFVEPILKNILLDLFTVYFKSSSLSFTKKLQRVYSFSKVTDSKCTAYLYDNINRASKNVEFDIIAAEPSIGDNDVYVQIMGDSYTNGGWFKDALIDKGYVPNIHCVGLRKQAEGQYDEGRGGWALNTYMRPSTGEIASYNPYWQPNGKRYWGSTGFWITAWKCKNGTQTPGFEPNYSCGRYDDYVSLFNEETGYVSSPKTNDVMYDTTKSKYVEYNGSSWVEIDESSLVWGFSFIYLDMFSIKYPTFFCMMLGINDYINGSVQDENSLSSWCENIKLLCDAYLQKVPSGKFVICLPCSASGTLNNNDGLNTVKQHINMWYVRKALINNFDSRESENIYIVDTSIAIDNENAYTTQEINIGHPNNTSITEKIKMQTGLPHPYKCYPSMGITLAAFIQKYR